jgi:hypothetical protein
MSDSNDKKTRIPYQPGYSWYLDELDRDTSPGVSPMDEYFSRSWKEDAPCEHEWVNVSFNFVHEACKHCGIDKKD